MRKYILVVLIFILSACSLGQKHVHQSANAPTETSVSTTPTSVATEVAKSAPTSTPTPTSAPASSQPSRSPLSLPPIPQNGAYLGAWVNPAKGTSGGGSTFVSQLPQFQSDLGGKLPGILNFYADFLSPLPLTDLQAIEAKGSIPLISWGGAGSCASSSIPAGQYSSGIASGQYDQEITQFANSLKAFGYPVFVRWFWEIEPRQKERPL